MKCPCKNCDRRKLGCHGNCEPYQQWSAGRHEINRKRMEENESQQLSRDQELKIRRNLRGRF